MKETVKYWVINDDTLALISDNLCKHYLFDLLTELDLDASVAEFDSLIPWKHNREHIGRKTITIKDHEIPWITLSFKNLISKRQRQNYLLKQNKNCIAQYKAFKNPVTK